jgi:transposase-like protein
MKTPTFKSILELATHFNNDQVCREYLAEKLWNGKPVCPHCGNEEIYNFSDGRRYKCKTCKKQFTVTVGTIFEGSHIKLQKWFMAIYLLTAHKKGISSLQLSRDLNITQKSAWYMCHRLRYAFKSKSFLAPMTTIVEMDEMYIGGKDENRHSHKKGMEKTSVFGILERGGEVRVETVKNVDRETLFPIIYKHVAPKTKIMTDEAKVYLTLNKHFIHESINHFHKEYTRGIVSTNGIENFWSLVKRGITGIYHQVSPKHLDKYLDEFEFRFNSRKTTEQSRFDLMITRSNGYLSYKELIK